jgi:replicative DNA helicase
MQPKVVDIQSRQKPAKHSIETLTPLVDLLPKEWRFCVCNGNKVPQGAEWQNSPFDHARLLESQNRGVFSDLWLEPSDGGEPFNVPLKWCKAIGVMCGAPSGGLLMLDHDGKSCDRLIEKLSGLPLSEALPKSAVVTSGLAGRYQIAYQVPEHFWNAVSTKRVATGSHGLDGKAEQLEFRWTGAQSIVLGEHPETGSYRWVYHPNDIPVAEAPIWMIEQMLESGDIQIPDSPKSHAKPKIGGNPNCPPIPLVECCRKVVRMALAGSFGAGRNSMGYEIAAELIATAQYLTTIGVYFEGDPASLFDNWCSEVGLDSDTPKGQPTRIWNSALKRNPTPTRPASDIEKTLKWWEWKHRETAASNAPSPSTARPGSLGGDAEETPLTDVEQLKAALNAYTEEQDPFKKILIENNLSKNYQLRSQRLDGAIEHLNPTVMPEFKLLDSVCADMFAQIEARSMSSVLPGVKTGFTDIDEMLQGLQGGDLIVVAARPSMGKTALVLSIAKNVSEYYEKPVLFYSLEMAERQLAYRLLAAECNVSSQNLRSGNISDEEWIRVSDALGRLTGIKLAINDSSLISIEQIDASARKMKEEHGSIGLIAIDYLQLLSFDESENRTIGISKVTRKLKILARELEVPVIALSQLSRSVEQRQDKRPIMSDLRDSGGIEQDADQVIMLYRDEYYNKNSIERGTCEVIVSKNRNGPVGTVRLLFEPSFTRFSDNLSSRNNQIVV